MKDNSSEAPKFTFMTAVFRVCVPCCALTGAGSCHVMAILVAMAMTTGQSAFSTIGPRWTHCNRVVTTGT